MKSQNIITGEEFAGYPLLPYDGPNAGFRQDILQRIKERLEESLQFTSKVLVVRLVVRFPQAVHSDGSNDCLQYFIEEYRRALGNNLIHYLWVREQNASHNPHCHLMLLMDGNQIRYFGAPIQAKHFWALALQKFYSYYESVSGLIHICPGGLQGGIPMNNGMLVHRENQPFQLEAFRQGSYLAKIATKGAAPPGVREFGASIMKNQHRRI